MPAAPSQHLYSCRQIKEAMALWILWMLCAVSLLVQESCSAAPSYKTGSCGVSISNWMVTGSCILTGMYSSDNNYNCKWKERGNNKEFGGFQNKPVTYTEQNSRNYTEGVCSFAKQMPLISGLYTYTMKVSPGGFYLQKEITIGEPYQVKLTHSCPKYVFEGSSINCTCSASRDVTPPALLVWEGRNDAKLLLANISRQQDQEQFTCQVKWGPDGSIKENTSYTLTVAYGPSDVLVTSYKKKTGDESETIRLTCTATDVYPSAVFQWNVTCSNQTDHIDSSTCSFNFTQKFESLAILCTASNTYYHQENASHVYVLSSLGNKQADTAGLNAGLIGGVVAAVLLVLIIVAVLIVYIIKRRKGMLDRERAFLGISSDPHKDFHKGPAMPQPYAVVSKPKTQTQTQTQTQTPIRRQAGPLGDMYTITNTTSSGHVVDDYATVCGTVNNNTSGAESPDTYQETHNTQRTTEPTEAFKPTTKPTITNNASIHDWQGTDYMNVTEVPTDSGLGVYHVVPWATPSGQTEPETREYSVPTFSEDEYNELHFEEDRTGQEDQAATYHHLQIT
ncbi:uncharacterized protein LOC112568827 isoform X2 [Pomacea canaliculata]|uniref:uncharacterized protein LOC112568827 isoform X2 n=1 Tax=Pomacea canaliculata TaxID=400727 RepID=UPI000D729E43|nr:uncharacterized protein LOC112568827 isoform X2 [Pomacea canaliculata]